MALLLVRFLRNRPKTVRTLQASVLLLTATTAVLLLGPYLESLTGKRIHYYHLPRVRTATARHQGSPNVIFVVVDALRADALSAYGHSRDTSPFLTQMAAEGILFTRYYAVNSWSLPASVSMTTGLFPSVHGVMRMKGKEGAGSLRAEIPTLLEILKKEGYNTTTISTNLLIDAGNSARGSDYFRGMGDLPETVPALKFFFWRKLDAAVSRWGGGKAQPKIYTWLNRVLPSLHEGTLKAVGIRDENKAWWNATPYPQAPEVNEFFLKYLDEVESERGFDRNKHKFFFYLWFMDPHRPYIAPPPYDKQYMPPSERQEEHQSRLFVRGEKIHGGGELLPGDVPILRRLDDGEIRCFDDSLRTLFTELQQRGWLDNTVVIITADHGDEFYEHGGFRHDQNIFNEVVKIPLIMWYPKELEARRVEHLSSQVDLMPTILELLGVPPPPGLQGQSLLSLERAEQIDRAIFGEQIVPKKGKFIEERFIIQQNHKLIETIESGAQSFALYRLDTDPTESHNLLQEGQAPPAQLRRTLEQFKLQNQGHKWSVRRLEEGEVLDKALEERLRALGYLE